MDAQSPHRTEPRVANFFLCIVIATLLASGAQAQESTPPAGTPSVADAARAVREGQKTMPPTHVITNDDIEAKREPADLADTRVSEQEVRAEMEKNYPPILPKADLVDEDQGDAVRRGQGQRGYSEIVRGRYAGWV